MPDPVGKEKFDADLAETLSGVTDYISAVDAFIALPPVIDLTTEDDSVKAAFDAVTAARQRVPNPPPPPAPTP